MRKIKLLLIIITLAIVSLNYETYHTHFIQQTKSYLSASSKDLQVSLDKIITEINAQDSIIDDKSTIIPLFKQARFHFKKIEFIADYNAEDIFKIPLVLDEKRNFIIEAFAFHVLIDIEAMLAEDKIEKQAFKNLIKEFQYRNLKFYEIVQSELISESTILEALKYNIIKIETLNITDFDCETTRNSIQDIQANFLSIDTCLALLAPQTKSNVQEIINQTRLVIKSANNYLEQKDFETLERLYFPKQYLHPLNALFSQILKDSEIPLNEAIYNIIRAVNLYSDNIYNKDFLYTPFYSVNKYKIPNQTEIELGKHLFFDKRLSKDGKMSCATCHQPELFFTDGLATSLTNQVGIFQDRNTPTILNSVYQRNLFYDLRAKNLEHQASQVVENHQEFNNNYDTIVERLKNDKYYNETFKQLYPSSENYINAATINAAIAAFEHQLTALDSKFDKYMRNESPIIDKEIENGYNLFMGKAKCGTCHFAPTFFGTVPPFYSESESEVLGVPINWDTLNYIQNSDVGRYKLLKFDFFKNSFKTSTIRNAEYTAPYMHNGSFKTLEDVLDFYNRGGGAAFISIPNQTLSDQSLNLTSKETKDIISFINALTDSTWNTLKAPVSPMK